MGLVQDKEGGTLQAEEKNMSKSQGDLEASWDFFEQDTKSDNYNGNIDKLDYIE